MFLFSLLLRPMRTVAFVCVALGCLTARAQITVPRDPSSTTKDEYAQGGGSITHTMPIQPTDTFIEWGSDMPWAIEHDLRWGANATSGLWGADSRIASLFSKGNTFFVKTGDTFGKILSAYMEIQKLVELYNQMQATAKFMDNYQLKVNLYRFLPVIDCMAPDEMGGGQAFAVGILPKDSTGWEARNNILNDNPWRRKNSLRLVEVRYPHNFGDLTLDASVWGPQTTDEEEFQKMLFAGVYDGVMSASSWMENAGIANNMADNVANIGPKAFARRKEAILMRRITALQERRDYLNKVANGFEPRPDGMTPEEVFTQIGAIDQEIDKLSKQASDAYSTAYLEQQVWMRQASFVHEILAKLEHSERRLTIMKLNERYRKYEKFWASPDQMNPTPELTGQPKVDEAIFKIWSALTLLSKGKIPPPTPVPGGLAAEAQATITRSMYRELMVDELRAVRRLLVFRYMNERQERAVDDVEAGRQEVERMNADLDMRANQIKHLEALANVHKQMVDGGYGEQIKTASYL